MIRWGCQSSLLSGNQMLIHWLCLIATYHWCHQHLTTASIWTCYSFPVQVPITIHFSYGIHEQGSNGLLCLGLTNQQKMERGNKQKCELGGVTKEGFTMIQSQRINTSDSSSENTVLSATLWQPTQTITQWQERRVYRSVWHPTTMVCAFTCTFMWLQAFKIWWEFNIGILPTRICLDRKMPWHPRIFFCLNVNLYLISATVDLIASTTGYFAIGLWAQKVNWPITKLSGWGMIDTISKLYPPHSKDCLTSPQRGMYIPQESSFRCPLE